MKIRKLMEANGPLEDISYSLEVEQDLEGPEIGVETGVSGLLLDQISKVAQNINDYNMLRANLEDYPEIDELIQSLADQENETLGKLQSALKSISPNAELIMNGAVEAESDLDPGSPIDEALDEKKYKKTKYTTMVSDGASKNVTSSSWKRVYEDEAGKKYIKIKDGYSCIENTPAIKYLTIDEAYGKKNVKNMKIIKEAHYGGAFDIEDDQFFTRDDLDEFGYYVEEELNDSDCSCPKEFQYAGCWIDNNIVTCAMSNGDYEHEIDFKVDMRRIRYPRDLIKRYAPGAIEEFKEAFETYYSYEM